MLWEKRTNLMLEAFTSDIISIPAYSDYYCIYYPGVEATFDVSMNPIDVPDTDTETSVETEFYSCTYYFSKGIHFDNVDIKIRQNFGKQFTFITYFSINGEGIFYIHSYCPKFSIPYVGSLVLTTKSTPSEGLHDDSSINDPYFGTTVYQAKKGQMYMAVSTFNWVNNSYHILHNLYNYSTKKIESNHGSLSYDVKDPMTVSNEIPGLHLFCEDAHKITFYGLLAYSCSLTNSDILECLNTPIYFTKTSSQLMAKKFNEYYNDGSDSAATHNYLNPTFYKDGTVFCSGQLIEGTTCQVDKDSNIKCQEFIEY